MLKAKMSSSSFSALNRPDRDCHVVPLILDVHELPRNLPLAMLLLAITAMVAQRVDKRPKRPRKRMFNWYSIQGQVPL